MSRTKKTRKQGKLTTFLPTGPTKSERLADPDSREARRKRALERKRRQQRSLKKDPQAVNGQQDAGGDEQPKRRPSRLKHSAEEVALQSKALLETDSPSTE